MANRVYPSALAQMLTLFLMSSVVKAQLVDLASYTPSDSHQFLADIPNGARVGAPVALTGKSVTVVGTKAVFDASNTNWSGLSGVPDTEALALYVDTGNEATSPLFLLVDTATGLPISAGSVSGTVLWDNGTDKIFFLQAS